MIRWPQYAVSAPHRSTGVVSPSLRSRISPRIYQEVAVAASTTARPSIDAIRSHSSIDTPATGNPGEPRPLKISPIADIRAAIFYGTLIQRLPYLKARSLNGPASIGALFDRITEKHLPIADRLSLIRRIALQRLLTREDGHEFCQSFGSFVAALGKGMTLADNGQILSCYNSILSRLSLLNVPLSNNLVSHGILLASAARTSTALKHYVQLFAERQKLSRWSPHQIYQAVFNNLRDWVENDEFTGWDGFRRKLELLNLLTGWANDGVRKPNEVRQVSIHSIMQKKGTILRRNYLLCLRVLAGADAVFEEWLQFQRSPLWERIYTSDDGSKFSDGKRVADIFAKALLLANDPRRAWQVVRESKCEPQMLEDSTWSRLLDHPEHLHEWRDGMAEPILKKYEEYLVNIEKELGVRWSGGEGGSHIAIDEDQEEAAEGNERPPG